MENSDRIIKLKQAVDRSRELSKTLECMKAYREALEQKIKALKESLLIEDQDVTDLKGVNVSTLLLTIRGKLGERKEREESEALAVRLKLSEAEKELGETICLINKLCEEHKALVESEAEYERLYELHKQRLIREGGDASRKTADLSENIARMKAELKEINDTLNAGEKLVAALDGALVCLERAEEFREIEFGTKGIRDVKYEYLDEASEYVENAKQLLDAFKTETAYVDTMRANSVNTGFIVADILFENIIPNWYTEGKVDRAKTRIAVIRSEVFCDVLRLRQHSEETQDGIDDLEARLDALVLGAAE